MGVPLCKNRENPLHFSEIIIIFAAKERIDYVVLLRIIRNMALDSFCSYRIPDLACSKVGCKIFANSNGQSHS